MKDWKKYIVLLVVLLPSIFFISRAFGNNSISLKDDKLSISGAGGVEIPFHEIDSMVVVKNLPELNGTGGISLGIIKKGNFLRASDGKRIRVVKNSATHFIHLYSKDVELYFNLDSEKETDAVFQKLTTKISG